MIFLLAAIICSASIALLFKYSETNNLNRYVITTTNYLTAFLISLILFLMKPMISLRVTLNFGSEFSKVVLKNSGRFSEGATVIWAIILGVTMGMLYFASFIFYQKSVKENGASLSGVFSRLGMILPMLISIIIWREFPSAVHWVGIILAIIAIVIINVSFDKKDYSRLSFTLAILFLSSGMGDFENKLFQKYAVLSYKELFLLIVFFTAFVLSSYLTIKKSRKIEIKALTVGILVGVPNLFSSYFLILALNSVPTALAFPIYSAGSILFITAGSVLLFKERIKNKDYAALVIVLAALVLMNI